MKRYTTELVKLIALAIVVPMLVMAYTTIEKSVTSPSVDQTIVIPPAVTPASIKFIDNVPAVKAVTENAPVLVKYTWPVNQVGTDERGQKGFKANRFSLILL